MPDEQITPREGMHKVHAWLIIGAVVVVVGLAFAFIQWKFFGTDDSSVQNELAQLMLGRDFMGLAQRSKEAADATSDERTKAAAKGAEAYAQFMLATPASRLEAVRIATEQYQMATHPYVKALAINQLIEFVTVSKTDEVFDAVFKNEPFKKYYKADDYAATIGALAEESFTLRPTAVGAGYSIMANAGHLSNFGQKYTLSAAQKKAEVEAVIRKITRLETGNTADMQTNDAQFRTVDTYAYLHWKAKIYGILARADVQYQAKAIESYEALFAFYDTTRDGSGRHLPILEVRSYDDHMAYAQVLIRIGGEASLAKAREHVKAVVDMVAVDPQLHASGYIQYLKGVASGTAAGDAVPAGLKRASEVYPPFKDFVKQYGVTL